MPKVETFRKSSLHIEVCDTLRRRYNAGTLLRELSMCAHSIAPTLQNAQDILLAKALEQNPAWKAEDSARISRATSYALGEQVTAERFLVEHAKAVLQTAQASGMLKKLPAEPKDRSGAVMALFLIVAFVLGAATDRITSPGNFINLLSFSFWGLVAWNLCAYLLIGLFTLRLLNPQRFLLRKTLDAVLAGHIDLPWSKATTQNQYFAARAKLLTPILQKKASQILHLSAVAFTVGLIASIAVRGISTAFVVGWESTWFANDSGTVKALLDAAYGWIPTGLGLPALPDAATLENLRSDRLSYFDARPLAAPWLARMMIVLVGFIILPRLLLAGVSTLGLRHRKAHIRLTLDDPYFEALLSEAKEVSSLGELFFIVDKKSTRSETLKELTRRWGNTNAETVLLMDFDLAPFALPKIATQGRRTPVLLCFNATRTPEDELTGALLDTATTLQGENPDLLFGVLLEMHPFQARQAAYPERIEERISYWRHYATQKGFSLFVSDDNPGALVKNVRQWASETTRKIPTRL